MVAITHAAWERMLRHCVGAAPVEAVGMLAGRDDVAQWCEPLRNIAPAPENLRAFLADPYEQFRAERDIAARGLDLIAIYHSHPGGGATLSAEDLEFSRKRACLQVVVALPAREMDTATLRAFQVVDDTVMEVPILVR